MISDEKYKLIKKYWLDYCSVYTMWQNINRKHLKVLGIANLKDRVNNKYFYDKTFFVKDDKYAEYRLNKNLVSYILQNKPLTKKQVKFLEMLRDDKFNELTDTHKKMYDLEKEFKDG